MGNMPCSNRESVWNKPGRKLVPLRTESPGLPGIQTTGSVGDGAGGGIVDKSNRKGEGLQAPSSRGCIQMAKTSGISGPFCFFGQQKMQEELTRCSKGGMFCCGRRRGRARRFPGRNGEIRALGRGFVKQERRDRQAGKAAFSEGVS